MERKSFSGYSPNKLSISPQIKTLADLDAISNMITHLTLITHRKDINKVKRDCDMSGFPLGVIAVTY